MYRLVETGDVEDIGMPEAVRIEVDRLLQEGDGVAYAKVINWKWDGEVGEWDGVKVYLRREDFFHDYVIITYDILNRKLSTVTISSWDLAEMAHLDAMRSESVPEVPVQ